MADSLKQQAFRGTSWSAVERFSVQGINFLIQLVLARLLVPADYGVISMLAIFLQIAQVFIDSGFANALIKKKECTNADYSTVFYYNLLVAVALYTFFFFIAPLVGTFYNVEVLPKVMRVISITLILNALCIVQRTILVKRIDFKTQSKISFFSAFFSGSIGIYFAYKGLGVWALCIQSILNSLFQVFLFVAFVRWRPALVFSKQSFKEMFGYGSKILGASLISTIYSNLYTIVIGKKFAASNLGLYSRADQFAYFPSHNIGHIISRVTFPVLSKIQDNNERLTKAYRRIIQYSSFVLFPIMIGLLSLSYPFIEVILTSKWIEAVPYMRILCIALMFDHLSLLNLNLLYVKGRSDLVLKLEIIKKSIALTILFLTLPFGIVIMCWGRVLYSLIAVYINTYYTKKLINLSFWKQMSDIFPYLTAAFVTGITVFLLTQLLRHPIYQLIIGIVVGLLVYGIISYLFFKSILTDLYLFVKRR